MAGGKDTTGSDTISVAIIDEGVQYTHPDLTARFGTLKGYDCFAGDADPSPDNPSTEQHGTVCAGEACATINNGAGIAGISNSRLYAVRAMDQSGGTDVNVSDAIQWAMNHHIRIISMSLGFVGTSDIMSAACQSAWDAGEFLCAASGNDGLEEVSIPAGYPSVVAVGSIGKSHTRSSFSNYGSYMNLVAPGEYIYSTIPGSSYQGSWAGTSMACPEVAGAAALILSANPSLSNQQVKDILDTTATDLGTTGWDKYYGYGEPNLLLAVEKALGAVWADTGMITVYNGAGATGTLYVSNITWKAAWVKSVSPANFTVAPGSSKGVTIVLGGKVSTGVYYDTLNIISNDTTHNPYLVVLRLRVGVGTEENTITSGTKLLSMFPNPCSKKAEIRYQVSKKDRVSLKLYDMAGRLVRALADKEVDAGTYTVSINTQAFPSGIYFLKFSADKQESVHKLVLLK